jgi:hypothetical protein
MKKRIITISVLFLCISTQLLSQVSADLTGDWTVTKIIFPDNLNPDMKSKLSGLSNSFVKSKFHFKSNKEFIFDCPIKDIDIKSAKWDYDETKKMVSVTGKDPQGNVGRLMGFTVKIIKSIYYFSIEESPIVLQVQKSELAKNSESVIAISGFY